MEPSRRSVLGLLAGAGASAALSSNGGAAAPDERAALLRALLDRNHQLHPEYRGGLSNHVSMGLRSLAAIGGSPAQLTAFAESKWPSLEPLTKEAAAPLGAEAFASQLGQRSAHNSFRALFERELAEHGRADTLRKYLPGLVSAIGAAAFHAVIRTGYGVRFDDDREVADGLAYWAIAYAPLGALPAPGTEPEPLAILSQLHRARRGQSDELGGSLIVGRMLSAARLPEFAPAVGALSLGADSLGKLAAAAARLYTSTGGNFTALHCMTGAHALRLLSPYLPQPELAMRYYWQAFVAAYLAVGAPELGEPPYGSEPDWRTILDAALASTDEHDLKLVDVAREEGTFYRKPIYRHAAALRMRLV